MSLENLFRSQIYQALNKGGPGSGNFGHAGRPGERGGSVPGDGGGSSEPDEKKQRMDLMEKRVSALSDQVDDTIGNTEIVADGLGFPTLEFEHQDVGEKEEYFKRSLDKKAERIKGILAESGMHPEHRALKYQDGGPSTGVHQATSRYTAALLDVKERAKRLQSDGLRSGFAGQEDEKLLQMGRSLKEVILQPDQKPATYPRLDELEKRSRDERLKREFKADIESRQRLADLKKKK